MVADRQDEAHARHELETLRRLHAAGCDVPRPLAEGGNALLMEYLGNRTDPAPPLYQATLPRERAGELFRRVTENIARWHPGRRRVGGLGRLGRQTAQPVSGMNVGREIPLKG